MANVGATWQQKSSEEDSHLILKPGHGEQAVAREREITPAQAFGILGLANETQGTQGIFSIFSGQRHSGQHKED